MSGSGSRGGASGGKARAGIGYGFGGGDRAGGRGGGSSEREHSGGVSLLPYAAEAGMPVENCPSAPAQGGWFTPSQNFQWRSGASEHDAYFWPQPRGERAAAPAGPAGQISGEMRGVMGAPAGASAGPRDLVNRRILSVDDVERFQEETKHQASIAANQQKMLGGNEESLKLLQDQLADAMSQLRAKDSTIDVQNRTIQALATPGESQTRKSSPAMSTGSLNTTPGRRRYGEHIPLPARPAGPIPHLTPHQRRRLHLSPNKADDVFGKRAMSPTPTPMTLAATDDLRSLQELLSTCFSKVEAAIRSVPILDIVPRDNRGPNHKQMEIITLLQGHLNTKQLAYDLLKDSESRIYAITALMCHTFVDTIFTEHLFGSNANFAGAAYLAAFTEENKTNEYSHSRVRDFDYRKNLSDQRASAAKNLIQSPGFWTWLNGTTNGMTQNIVRDYSVCFPDRFLNRLTQELHKVVSEAVRITVRMRQEPNVTDYNFPPTGTPWHSNFHVHRNHELMGHEMSNDKSPFAVRIALMPLIKSKSFSDGKCNVETIHKAEVVVGDRDTHMRMVRKR